MEHLDFETLMNDHGLSRDEAAEVIRRAKGEGELVT